MTDREANRFSARAARYARVGANVGGVAARLMGARFLGLDLDRAQNATELAAAYASGIVRNHPSVDGNKRVAFLTMAAFLRLNGVHFAPSQEAATAAILALAAGEVDEAGFARWLVDNIAASRASR